MSEKENIRLKILIVDDESSIRKTLEGIFQDEGFQTSSAASGSEALRIIQDSKPDLVFLDIWMPGMDGLETLKEIKLLQPEIKVVMISGHATIATAIMATRLGASDFVEKPLDLNVIVAAARRALGILSNDGDSLDSSIERQNVGRQESLAFNLGTKAQITDLNPVVFSNQQARGRAVPQKTLAHSTLLYGQGLHSGKKSGLILEPLPPNSGIHFVGVSEKTLVPAHVDYVGSTGFATTVKLERTQVGTIEHLMSALHAYGISNLLIKCNGEVPVMDGSSREFCALFEEVGLEVQPGEWFEIAVPRLIKVGNEREFIQFEPGSGFVVDYTLDYPAPVGRQQMTFNLSDVEAYKREIASARTFGFVKDIGALQKQGLALGGRFDNFVLFGSDGPINDKLRFADEPVRHKILDAIGDLYLLGRKISGKVTAKMTGHSDNIALLRALRDEIARC